MSRDRSALDRPLVAVCVPGNRRLALFTEAARATGLPDPVPLDWRELADPAAGPPALPEGALVRVDSAGEDAPTARLLRGWRHDPDLHRVEGGADQHRGFVHALGKLSQAVAATPGAHLLQDVDDLADLCDKRRCHARLNAAGVPVAPAPPERVTGYDSLREAMAGLGWRRVFVKSAHGSSASGVVALATAPGGRIRAVTSAHLVRDGGSVKLYNSLRPFTYTDEADVAAIVDALAPDGLHVERWVPKAGFQGRVIDLRVLVVAGRATHAVVRSSRSPMTNLHLGNARGDLAALRESMGPRTWRAATATAEAAAGVFPRTLHTGVDLLVSPGWRGFTVCEVNAFGDLLPGVLHEGRSTQAEQLHALATGRFPLSAPHPTPVHALSGERP
ncbi:STM4014 family protein [Nocardiopsis sp. B62]|uniref:STM4014 family protein n=1 Tax=Nocardiopsis sp. B62 TaxID=2824874 RepID=UPI001B35D6D9|nr:STM4014 family protein [Nocardiopsis sp. B62]MBQ1081201.1 STM4014 family protein [Nocardiopsis sp. B62]